MSSSTPLLEIKQLSKSFEQRKVVDVSHLSVAEGEFFSLLGSSGCGKSTILRLIAGFESADTGQILSLGRDITHTPVRLRDMNMVFQNYALFPHLNVFDNVAFGLSMQKKSPSVVRDEVHAALRLVQMLDLSKRFPNQLSGGQQQRVALARAVAPRPSLLLLDEPLGALDLKLRHVMQFELKRIQREVSITFVYVTHDQGEALTMSDRIAVFDDGRIQQLASPQELYERPQNSFVAGFIGENNRIMGTLVSVKGDHARVKLQTGEVITAAAVNVTTPGQQTMVSVRPERATILTNGDQDDLQTLDAEVIEVVYMGDLFRTVLKVAGNENFVVKTRNTTGQNLLTPGQKVKIGWVASDARALDP